MDKKVTINGKEYTERVIGHVNLKLDQTDEKKIDNKNNSYTISSEEINAINQMKLDINVSGSMLKTPQPNEAYDENILVMSEQLKSEELNINDNNKDEASQKKSWIKKLVESIKKIFIK